MSNEIIDLVPKSTVFSVDLVDQQKQDLTIAKAEVKKRDKIKYLTKEDINPILNAISDARDKLYITLLWKTGIRVAESINIEKRHINPVTNRLTIRWLKSRNWNEREINAPKELVDQLLIYARALKYDDKLFNFTRQRAEQITKKYFGVSPHVFRHSFAMNWVDQEHPIDVLQLQLGHKHINTTMVYLHTSAKRARVHLDQILWE